jgi:hypothetical protein
MPHVGNPVRALVRLDDRVLGRWLNSRHRPVPVGVDIALTAAVVAVAVLFTVLTGNVALLIAPLIAVAAGWYRRAHHARRSG